MFNFFRDFKDCVAEYELFALIIIIISWLFTLWALRLTTVLAKKIALIP